MKKSPAGNINSKNIAPAIKTAGVISVKNTTKSRTHEIVLNEHYKRLELSINQIIRLNDILLGNNSDKDIKVRLDSLFESLFKGTGESALAKFEILKLKNQKKSASKKYSHEYSGVEKYTIHETDESDEVNKLIAFHNGILRINEKIAEIELFKKFPLLLDSDNPDEIYEEKIRGTEYEQIFLNAFGTQEELEKINGMILAFQNYKYDGTEGMNGGPEMNIPNDFLKKRAYRGLTYKLSECESLKAEFDKLSITAFLDDTDIKKFLEDNSYGAHFTGTVINMIKDSTEINSKMGAIEHEKTHNIYHAFVPDQAIKGVDYFNTSFDRIARLMDLQAPEVIIESDFKLLKKKILNFFLSSQDEIIANFHDLKHGKLATALAQYIDIIKGLKNRKDNFLKSKKLSEGNSKILKHLNETIDGMSDYYSVFYRRLADLVFIAENEGLEKELFACIILWTPLKYNKIEKYFRMKIGNSLYDYYCTVRTILKPDFFITPKKKITDPKEKLLGLIFGDGKGVSVEKEFAIAKHKDYLSSLRLKKLNSLELIPNFEDKAEMIYDKIMETEFNNIFSRFKIDTVEKYLRYKRRLLKFLKNIGIKDKKLDDIGKYLDGDYDYYVCLDDKRVAKTEDMLDNFPKEYDSFLKTSIIETFEMNKGKADKKSKNLLKLILNHPRSKLWVEKDSK